MKLWNGEPSASVEITKGKYDWMKKPFLWLCFLYVVALLALLRADYSYVDDLGRALIGYRGWMDWSRYMTTALSFFVQPTPKLTDMSPLPQLLAVGIMSLAGLVVIYTLTGRKEIRWPFLLAALPMGLSPWFLECFSYKFDAPYMAVAVISSILPFLWWEKDEKKFYIASFLCLLAMITSYQAAAGIFVIAALFHAFFSWLRGGSGKSILLWLIRAALIYAAALLTFKVFLMQPPAEDYFSIELAPLADMPRVIWQTAGEYLRTVWQDLNWVMQGSAAAVVLFWLLHIRRATKRNRLLTLLLAVIFLLVTAVLSYGPYLMFDKVYPYPRGLFGMGLWFSFLMISLLSTTDGKGPMKWLTVLVAWQLIALAAAYGNALAVQKQYIDFRIQLLVQDLNTLHLTDDEKIRYHILGSIGHAPSVRNTETEYPVVKRLITPSNFSGANALTVFYFYFYHDLALNGEKMKADEGKDYLYLPVVLENRYHRIQADGEDVLIVLHESRWYSAIGEKQGEKE